MSLLKIEPQNTHDLILVLETYFFREFYSSGIYLTFSK